MTKNEQLGIAIEIAVIAHADQYDKGGRPYILHPLYLMHKLMYDTQLATIAVLHDVIEDSNYSLNDLHYRGISSRVTDAVSLLTHRHSDSYEEYINKICTNYDAVRVKCKDLEHNSNITRLKGVAERDIQRMEKYHKAFIKLTEAKNNFNKG